MPALIPEQLAKILYEVTAGKTGAALERATAEFASFLKERQQLSKLPYVLAAFVAYAKKQQGIVELDITTAHKQSSAVVKQIEALFGDAVETRIHTDKHMIGGVIAKAGNTILDGSVRAQLSRMKQTL